VLPRRFLRRPGAGWPVAPPGRVRCRSVRASVIVEIVAASSARGQAAGGAGRSCGAAWLGTKGEDSMELPV